MWVLRAVMLLALIVWIGGIIFFALIVAPTLFTVLQPQEAGAVVRPSLTQLHYIGLVAGLVFLLCSFTYNWRKYAQLRLLSASHVFIVLMLVMTGISQFVVTPRMRQLSGPVSTGTLKARAEFDRLHAWSTRLEGGVVLLGLGVVALTARRFGNSRE